MRVDHRPALLGGGAGGRLGRGGDRFPAMPHGRRRFGRDADGAMTEAGSMPSAFGGLGDALTQQRQPFGTSRRVGRQIDPVLQRASRVALLQLGQREVIARAWRAFRVLAAPASNASRAAGVTVPLGRQHLRLAPIAGDVGPMAGQLGGAAIRLGGLADSGRGRLRSGRAGASRSDRPGVL